MYQVVPGKSIGPISLGDTREVVRAKLNMPYKEMVYETYNSKEETDIFGTQSEIIGAYRDNILIALQFFEGNLNYDGLDIFRTPSKKIISALLKLDSNLKFDNSEFESRKLGIGGVIKKGKVYPLIIFSEDYYSDSDAPIDLDALIKYIEDSLGK